MTEKGFEEILKNLTRLRLKSSFPFELWLKNKTQIMRTMDWSLGKIIRNDKEYPAWNSNWSSGEIPRILMPGEVSKRGKPLKEPAYQSWTDYFQKQKYKVDDFKKTGEIKPLCEELGHWVVEDEIVGNPGTFLVLKKYVDLILEMLDNATAATNIEHFSYIIDSHDRDLFGLFYYISGWQKIAAEMLPDFEFGKAQRVKNKNWGKDRWVDYAHFFVSRNKDIIECAENIRRESKTYISILKLSEKLSKKPYEFKTWDGKPLSQQQIRKILLSNNKKTPGTPKDRSISPR